MLDVVGSVDDIGRDCPRLPSVPPSSHDARPRRCGLRTQRGGRRGRALGSTHACHWLRAREAVLRRWRERQAACGHRDGCGTVSSLDSSTYFSFRFALSLSDPGRPSSYPWAGGPAGARGRTSTRRDHGPHNSTRRFAYSPCDPTPLDTHNTLPLRMPPLELCFFGHVALGLAQLVYLRTG